MRGGGDTTARQPRRLWTPERVEALRLAYLGSDKTDVIALRFGTSRGRLLNIARANNWPTRLKTQRPRWIGAELVALETAWRCGNTLEMMAEQFGTSPARISKIASKHGWPERPYGPARRTQPAESEAGAPV